VGSFKWRWGSVSLFFECFAGLSVQLVYREYSQSSTSTLVSSPRRDRLVGLSHRSSLRIASVGLSVTRHMAFDRKRSWKRLYSSSDAGPVGSLRVIASSLCSFTRDLCRTLTCLDYQRGILYLWATCWQMTDYRSRWLFSHRLIASSLSSISHNRISNTFV